MTDINPKDKEELEAASADLDELLKGAEDPGAASGEVEPPKPADGGPEPAPSPEPTPAPAPPKAERTDVRRARESLEDMLKTLDEGVESRRKKFEADITALALHRAHDELVADADAKKQREVIEHAMGIRDRVLGKAPSAAPAADSSTDDTPSGDAPTVILRPRVAATKPFPTTPKELEDFVLDLLEPELTVIDNLENEVGGLVEFGESAPLRKYKRRVPVKKPATPAASSSD